MFFHLPEAQIDAWLDEDVPYGDLTSRLLGLGAEAGRITFTTREPTVLCGTEEAAGVLRRVGADVACCFPSGTFCPPGEMFLSATGPVDALHAAWKVSLNLLEYTSGIASRTRRLLDAARAVAPEVVLATTRKSFPGTKRLSLKAAVAGGAEPHRHGLGESVLVFAQHLAFLGGLDGLLARLPELCRQVPEHKVLVEVEDVEAALAVATAGAAGVQFDKLPPAQLSEAVARLRAATPEVLISAAGGINEQNAAAYAATGVDVLVTSAVYFGKPADIAARLAPLAD